MSNHQRYLLYKVIAVLSTSTTCTPMITTLCISRLTRGCWFARWSTASRVDCGKRLALAVLEMFKFTCTMVAVKDDGILRHSDVS